MSKIGATYSLTPGQLGNVLRQLVSIKQPAMVWGPPGVGKSDVCKAVAKELDYEYIDVRANLLDPVDLRGLPRYDSETDTTRWAHPSFLPHGEKNYLINLEELPSAVPAMQAALYQLILDRAVGEYQLPEGAAIIGAGNRQSDRGVVHRMPTPLASRLVHLEVKPDINEWMTWATRNGIAPEVIFFLRFRPELLHLFDPDESKDSCPAFPCPRTWEFVSNIMNGEARLPIDIELPLIRGTVGEAASVEFVAFMRVWRNIPNPMRVFEDPDGAEIPTDQSALLALCGALYRKVNKKRMPAMVRYANRLRREVGTFLIDSACNRDPELKETGSFVKWVVASTNKNRR